MPNVEDGLDWQIYFAKNDDGTDSNKTIPFYWHKNGEPLTLRSVYPQLKAIFESEKVENKTKSEFRQGHRNKMFTQEQIEEMVKLKEQGLSNIKIRKILHCDKKTIRNYLKLYMFNNPI